MQNQFSEQELLNLIHRYSKLLSLFEDQNSKETQVIILIGVTGVGKSTLFNFLAEAEFEMTGANTQQCLNIKLGSSQFAIIKGGMKSITKSPNYYFSQKYNTLLIDFPGFQDTDGKIDQVLIQLLFYQIVKSPNVKILYVVKHPETRFNNRGTQLQEFIRQTFKGQNLEISQICLLLNCYNDKLSDDKLIQNVQGQLEEIYNCRPQNICVMRKIKNNQDIEQYLTPQKRDFFFQTFLKSNSVEIFPDTIPQSEQISQYLNEKSQRILDELCSSLDKCLQIDNFSQDQIKNVENCLKEISSIINNQNKDTVKWLLELINQLIRSNQLLKCQITIDQSHQNFLKIFKFFAQFQECISEFGCISQNGIIAQEKCENIIKIVKGKLDLLEKQRELLEEQEQKRKAMEERQQAELDRQLQANLATYAQFQYKETLSLHMNTQYDLNQQIQETNKVRAEKETLFFQTQKFEKDSQIFEERKLKKIEEIQRVQLNMEQQINENNEYQKKSQQNLDNLNNQHLQRQEQQKRENENLEKMLENILTNHKQLAQLVENEIIKKDELIRMIQNSQDDQNKLKQEITELAQHRCNNCQLI